MLDLGSYRFTRSLTPMFTFDSPTHLRLLLLSPAAHRRTLARRRARLALGLVATAGSANAANSCPSLTRPLALRLRSPAQECASHADQRSPINTVGSLERRPQPQWRERSPRDRILSLVHHPLQWRRAVIDRRRLLRTAPFSTHSPHLMRSQHLAIDFSFDQFDLSAKANIEVCVRVLRLVVCLS